MKRKLALGILIMGITTGLLSGCGSNASNDASDAEAIVLESEYDTVEEDDTEEAVAETEDAEEAEATETTEQEVTIEVTDYVSCAEYFRSVMENRGGYTVSDISDQFTENEDTQFVGISYQALSEEDGAVIVGIKDASVIDDFFSFYTEKMSTYDPDGDGIYLSEESNEDEIYYAIFERYDCVFVGIGYTQDSAYQVVAEFHDME